MLSHLTIGARDVAGLAAFYDTVLGTLGIARFWTDPAGGLVGWSQGRGFPRFFITVPFDGRAPHPGNGTMVAFLAPSQAAVAAAHAACLAHGGSDEGPPGLRPHYTPTYYGAYGRDPEGNKICFVHHGD